VENVKFQNRGGQGQPFPPSDALNVVTTCSYFDNLNL